MRTRRLTLTIAACLSGLIATTGVAYAAFTDAVLLTEAEAQQAAGYPGTLTAQTLPVTTPGLLMRLFKGGEVLPTTFTVMVIDPQGTGGGSTDSKSQVEKLQQEAKANTPGLECKVYENKPPKFTVVCWSNDPAMVLGFSGDLKTYSKKKKVNGKMRTVVFKEIPVIGTVQRFLIDAGGSDSDSDTASARMVSDAAKDQAAREAKGLRDAQKAKLPNQYS